MTHFAEVVMTGLLGVWMTTGVYDNWRFPDLNRAAVSEVMRLDRMARDYPEDYAVVAHRKIVNPRVIRLAFRLIVVWETIAAVLLCAGAVLLASSLVIGSDPEMARHVALAGALAFTANWAAFLIGGNYFLYYYCHFEGQFTHFLLVLWGSAVVVMLA